MPRIIDDNIQFNVNVADLPNNKEDFQLIWLDAALDESSDILATQEMLQTLNTNAQFYTNVDKCLELIQSVKTEHILLVVSGQLAYLILPHIYSLRSVRAVFIFCETRELHTALLTEYSSKIIDIFTDRDALFKSISGTMQLIEKQDAAFHLFDRTEKATRDLTKESASFLWHQLLIDVLKKMPADEQAKNEMLDHCAAYYRHNKIELQKIEHFRTSYTSKNAVKYYTEDSFLYRLLNKALRTEDIELLHIFRFFIIDLCAQLEDGKKLLVGSEPLTLYRGQQIPKEEFENLKTKKGSLIATNGFLSTSREKNISLIFSSSSLLRQDMMPVLLTIKADPKLKTVTFADVSHQSEFEVEKEVLFSLGVVFRIDACEFDETLNIGKLVLTATDEGSETVMDFLNAQQNQLQVYSPMIYFGRLLMNEMNEIDRAATYFYTLLQTLPEDHPDIAEVYNQIGATHYMKSIQSGNEEEVIVEKQKALEMFEKALEIRRNMFGENDVRIAYSMNNIGAIYNDRKEYDRALECYQRGLHIIDIAKLEARYFRGTLLGNCGLLNVRSGNNKAALSFYIQADEMYSQCLPNRHPSRVENMRRIAELYMNNEDFTNALIYYKGVYESCEIMLIPTELKFKEAWEKTVRCCLKLGDNELAITYLDRVLRICERAALNVKKTSSEYVLPMAVLSESELNFEMALHCYKQYLKLNTEKVNIPEFDIISHEFWEISREERILIITFRMDTYEMLFPSNNFEHSSFLVDMGSELEECNSIDLAYKCYQKAFDILEQLTLDNDDDLLKCFKKLVDSCFEKNDDQLVLNYLEKALRKCKQAPTNNDQSHADFLSYTADKYEKIDEIVKALRYYSEALAFAEAARSYKDINILLQKIFKICVKESKYQLVQSYIQRAVKIYESDPVNLGKCYLTVASLYERRDEEDIALEYYKQFLLATEVTTSSFTKILDRMWIDFIIEFGDTSARYNIIEIPFRLMEILGLCDRHLHPHHSKAAVVSWVIGYHHEKKRIHHVALEYYQDAISIWEKLIYKDGDRRTVDALVYLLNDDSEDADVASYDRWLNGPGYSMSLFKMTFDNDRRQWECIVQRLKYLKMVFMDRTFFLHGLLRVFLSNTSLCTTIIQPMLKLCTDELYCVENRISSDIHSVICCLEFVSHWYFEKKQYLESLLHRQHQLELETKFFSSEHSHVGWSLWFIGMIFQQMNDYDLSLEYFSRALKILQHLRSNEHEDIQQLEEYISQTQQAINEGNATKNEENLVQKAETKKIKFNTHPPIPRLLQRFVHFD